MLKKIMTMGMAVLVLGALILSCGCSGSGEKSNATLLIGGIGPLSGDYANYGISTRNGETMAVDEINAAGGINGFTFKLDFQDSQGDGASAVSAYGKLQDEGMDVSLGAVLSGETAQVVAAAAADGILVLTPTGSSKDCIQGNDNAFRVCFNDPQQGAASAQYIYDNHLATKVAVFYGSDNTYCEGLYKIFDAKCKELGIEIVTVQAFTDGTNTDFTTQINAIKASGAKLVFLPIYAKEAATFLTQANGKLTDVIYFGCDGLDGILEKISNTEYVEGLLNLTPFATDEDRPIVQNFVKNYKEKFGKTPDQFAADGYDAVYAIAEALKKTGVTPETKGDDFNAKMVSAMTQITVDGVTGTMTWDPDGETEKAAKAMIIRNGELKLYTGKE